MKKNIDLPDDAWASLGEFFAAGKLTPETTMRFNDEVLRLFRSFKAPKREFNRALVTELKERCGFSTLAEAAQTFGLKTPPDDEADLHAARMKAAEAQALMNEAAAIQDAAEKREAEIEDLEGKLDALRDQHSYMQTVEDDLRKVIKACGDEAKHRVYSYTPHSGVSYPDEFLIRMYGRRLAAQAALDAHPDGVKHLESEIGEVKRRIAQLKAVRRRKSA